MKHRLLALAAVAALAVAGCGGDDDDDDVGAGSTTTTSTTEAAESTTTTEPAAEPSPEELALSVFAGDVLRWEDATLEPLDVEHSYRVSSQWGEAEAVLVGDDTAGWQVDSLFTHGVPEEQNTASVKLGYPGENSVVMGLRDPALTPDLTIHYGAAYDQVLVLPGETGGAAEWSPALDPALDTGPRRITVMWRDAAGVAIHANVLPVPAGEFAAG